MLTSFVTKQILYFQISMWKEKTSLTKHHQMRTLHIPIILDGSIKIIKCTPFVAEDIKESIRSIFIISF